MTIQKINAHWHIIDKEHDTITRDTVLSRCLSNALYKYIAFHGTSNPIKEHNMHLDSYNPIKEHLDQKTKQCTHIYKITPSSRYKTCIKCSHIKKEI